MLTEAIHGFGTKCCMCVSPIFPEGYDVSEGVASHFVQGDGTKPEYGLEMTEGMIMQVADYMVNMSVACKECGFDGVYIHNAYKLNYGRFFSPVTNKRTDKYGGSLENRIRAALLTFEEIKNACGKDFIIETSISPFDLEDGGWEMEETIRYAEILQGYADILHVRSTDIDSTCVLGFHGGPTPWLPYAEEVRAKAKTEVKILGVGGYHDLEACDRLLADGKVDLIGTACGFIADSDFGLKAVEGRSDDVIPCIRCNKCHRPPDPEVKSAMCSVNPKWALEHRLDEIVRPPVQCRKVAIVGGGPAGMNAALICADRGHSVTIFEKTGKLGGLLIPASVPSFKWPHKKFLEYQIHQVEKRNITVKYNTEATPGMIEAEDFDVVLACIGSEPAIPPIPGAGDDFILTAKDVLNDDGLAGDKVAIVGGGEIGVEAGMHLAELGHEVVVLEMQSLLAMDCAPVHYRVAFEKSWKAQPDFHSLVNVTCTKIERGMIFYIDSDGNANALDCDTVVLATGSKALSAEAAAFFGTAGKFDMLGDCKQPGSLQKLMKNSFYIANQI